MTFSHFIKCYTFYDLFLTCIRIFYTDTCRFALWISKDITQMNLSVGSYTDKIHEGNPTQGRSSLIMLLLIAKEISIQDTQMTTTEKEERAIEILNKLSSLY